MNSSEKDEEDKSHEPLRTKITTTISIGDSDSSFSLSVTPPSLGEGKNDEKNKDKAIVSENSQESISEHLSSIATSIENDRSLHEIEIGNIPALSLDDYNYSERENERLSQEAKPNLMSTSPHSDSNSVKSLAGSEHAEVKSILEDVLNNEKFVNDAENLSMRSEEDRFDIFADLDLDDKSLTQRIMSQGNNEKCDSNINDVVKQVKDLEEMIEDKNQAIIALSTELDSLREMVSNPSTLSIGSPTEYKQLHEEYHNKVVEYHNAIEQKDDLIFQLTESLQQSIANREDLKTQVEHFKKEIELLQKELGNPNQTQSKNESINEVHELKITDEVDEVKYSPLMDPRSADFETEYLQLQRMLNADQVKMLAKFNNTINKYIEHKLSKNEKGNEEVISNLKKTLEEERIVHDKEVERLRELLAHMKCGSAEIMEMRQEMEVIHQKETEDLRMYFEKKCADLEKNYAEEVFSQHSRKRSGSTTSSENELISDTSGIQRKPGPGGDAPSSLENYKVNYKKRALQHLSKSDLLNLKQDLENIVTIFNKFEIGSSSEESLGKLKEDLGNYDVQNLFKIEMEAFKNEMKNEYNAELEILNQDYENKVDLLMVQQEEKLNALKTKYSEEIENLKEILNKSNKAIVYSSAVQEVGSGDFEINEVVQSYERRLQEQVTMAKIDIIAALESQIQRLAANEGEDEEWPQELLTLRDRFTERFEKKIALMKDAHHCEIAKLKEEHIKNLNGALERARRRSLKDGENMNSFDAKVIGERDNFKKQASLLRKLLGELLKYFTQCEDEVNNTIVDELVRQATEKNLTDIERELNDSTSSSKTGSTSSSAATLVKRVHLTPNFSELMSILDNSSGKDSESMEFSTDLKNELESCLEKLRAEANAVLALSLNVSKKTEGETMEKEADDQSLSTLNRKLIEEVQLRMKISEELEEKSGIIESLERERNVLEAHVLELIERLNVTQTELGKSQIKISELLESGQQEEVSEGYGGMTFGGRQDEGHAIQTFYQLEEKARTLLVGSHSSDTDLLQLLEELVNTGERIIEETKAENKDLEQQIDAADKKYRHTCKFLEEQAADRELERDDYQKQILALQGELKNVDKDRATFANMNEEQSIDGMASSTSRKRAEQLETQLKEFKQLFETKERKLKETEAEKDEAVDKIYFLRDVIRDLESQVKVKADTEAELRNLISELEYLISQQNLGIRDSLEKSQLSTDDAETERLREHLRDLETEVQRLRVSQELVGTEGALREVRNQLIDIETTIDRKTKELEEQSSIVSTTTCSSPSEDMSVRDVVRPKTPTSLAVNECEIPLQQLARLKEKLIRHARAEDAALKRIRDLEMQVFTFKAALEENSTEKDILKKEISDQLVLISSLQIRLDDQRIRAEHIEKQTNSSLESRIYDLQKEISELQEHLDNRNKTIAHLNTQVDEMKNKIEDKETEYGSTSEDEMIVTMQKEIEHLRNQNELLHKRLTSGADLIPNLVENIISDKNSDIESLKQKLSSVEKQLEVYSTLNLDSSQISALKNLKNSGTSLSEVLSIVDFSTPDQPRRVADSSHDDFTQQSILRRNPKDRNDTAFLSTDDVREISSIEKIEPASVHFSSLTSSGKKNSTEISKLGDRRVHFNLSNKDNSPIELEHIAELERLKLDLAQKDQIINDCNERLKQLNQLETNIDFVQTKLEETQSTLKDMTEKFEKEISSREETEKELRVELVQKKMYLEELQKELQLLKEDAVRKDNMYFNLAKETKELKKEKKNLEEKVKEHLETEEVMNVKNQIILELEEELGKFRSKNYEDATNLEDRIRENEGECESLKLRLDSFSKENEQKDYLIEKLEQENKKLSEVVKISSENCEKIRKDLLNKQKQLEEYEKHMNRLNRQIEILKNEKTNFEEDNSILKRVISEKNEALEVLNGKIGQTHEEMTNLEDEVRKLRNHTVAELEQKVTKLQEENSSKNEEIVTVRDSLNKLNEELGHLQDLVIEKDKIIARFKEDSEQLQTNLECIQNKMQETGNIIDLGKKLRDEQVKNSELMEEMQLMRAELTAYKFMDKDPMETSIDEITGKMREELDYSARLDSNIMSATEDVENVGELEDTLSKLRLKYRDLSKKYAEAQENNNTLLKRLEKDRFEFNAVQLEDAKMMEQLRIHLDAAAENEADLEQSIETWKKKCETLEIEVSKLRSRLSNSNSRTESTEYKGLPTKESQELLRLKNDLAALNAEIAKCKNEIKSLKKTKKELESNLKYSKEMDELKHREIKNLEMNLAEKCRRESELKDKYTECNEILQDKIKEVENSRLLIDDMDQERKTMKEQINRLNANLRLLEDERKKPPMSPNTSFNIADQLMNKIEEINATVRNDRRTMDLILRLTNDNKLLKNKILELETAGTTNLESPMHRANYLFSKCLRIESYRKSLIWQKNYLISILGSYQYTTDLGPVDKLQGQKKIRFSGVRKFRCFVYSIIAILRMKFIVRRWHSGARLAENVNSRYQNVSVNFQRSEVPLSASRQSNFQVGQPVSSQQFAHSSGVRSRHVGGHGFQNSLDMGTVLGSSDSRLNVECGMSDRTRDIPWSGASPPCKEKSSGRPRISPNIALLKAPQLLNQYAERYNRIHENLEILLNPNPPA